MGAPDEGVPLGQLKAESRLRLGEPGVLGYGENLLLCARKRGYLAQAQDCPALGWVRIEVLPESNRLGHDVILSENKGAQTAESSSRIAVRLDDIERFEVRNQRVSELPASYASVLCQRGDVDRRVGLESAKAAEQVGRPSRQCRGLEADRLVGLERSEVLPGAEDPSAPLDFFAIDSDARRPGQYVGILAAIGFRASPAYPSCTG